MNFLTSLLTVLFCVAQAGCTPGNIGEVPNPKITFELPAEWANLSEAETSKKESVWKAIIPGNESNPEGHQGLSKFSMVELSANDWAYPGATPQEKAQRYYERMTNACHPEVYNCIVEPIREIEYADVKAYIISHNNNEGLPFDYWVTAAFFEKDYHMFKMGMRNKYEEEITQKTIKRVLETIKIGN